MARLACYFLLFLLQPLAASADNARGSPPVRIFIWEDYLSQSVLADFETTSGISAQQILFDTEATRLKRLASGLAPDFDVLLVDNVEVHSMATAGMLVELEAHGFDSYERIDPTFRDACGKHGLPYLWGTYGFAYRQQLVDEPLRSWRQLYQPPESLRGRVLLPEYTAELVGGALMALGHSYGSEQLDQLRAADALLRDTVQNVMHFGYSLNLLKNPQALDHVAAMGVYNGDFLAFLEGAQHDDWKFVYPDEGAVLWVDCLAIMQNSPAKAEALQLLGYLNQPQVAGPNSVEVMYATPVRNSRKFMPASVLENRLLYPDRAVLERAHVEKPIENLEALRLRNLIAFSITLFRRED